MFETPTHSPSRRAFLRHAGAMATVSLVGACSTSTGPQSRQGNGAAKATMLLPLSGQHADLGRAMAKAVWLVEDTGGARNRVTILDAGSTPDSAGLAARQAGASGADLVIGPLFSTQAAAVVSAMSTTPVITLSNDERLAKTGAWTFGVTPAQSVQASLRYARSQGANRLAYLQSSGPVGDLTAKALNKGARAARVKKVAPVSDEGNLMGALRSAGGGSLPDLFYVPGADGTARRVAAQAQKAGVQVVGSLQWAVLGSDALAQLDKACFAGPDPVRFARLSASYRARLEQELGILSALAVDAAAMAGTLRRKSGGKIAMTGRTQSDGLLGRCRFLSNRTCERELAMLKIDGGSVRKVA